MPDDVYRSLDKVLAEDRLTSDWLAANDRKAITTAAAALDDLLRTNPLDCGESRSGNARVVFVPPLGADVEVLPDDRLVYVLAVWTIRPV